MTHIPDPIADGMHAPFPQFDSAGRFRKDATGAWVRAEDDEAVYESEPHGSSSMNL